MEIDKTALALMAALCVTAGASGLYLATRSTQIEPAQAASFGNPDAALQPVEQSEAVVTSAPTSTATSVEDTTVSERVAPARSVVRPRNLQRPPAPRPPVETADDQNAVPATAPRLAAPPAIQPAWIPETTAAPAAPAASAAQTAAIEPIAPQFVDLTVPADAVLGLHVETSHTSERARVEDEVVASVTRDVRVGDRIAIPAGSKAYGEVTLVERGGRMRNRARLGIRFTSVVLADGTRLPISTEAFYREGDAPGGESAAKIGGGAIGGAIIGGIFGGARGAVIGGSVGAGAGTAAVLAGGRNAATLAAGTPVTVRLVEPATVTVEK